MKKYLLGLFLFAFLLVPVFSFAQVSDTDPNPTTSECVSLQNNLRYKDRDSNKNGEVSTLQDFLQSQNYLSSEPTGYFGLSTQKAVKSFQKDNQISPSGYVGPATRAKIKALTCDGVSPINHNPVLNLILAPTTANIGQLVDFKFSATDADNDNLSWSIQGGDMDSDGVCGSSKNLTWNGSHTWNTAGIYNITVTVRDCKGGTDSTSFSVNVGNTKTTIFSNVRVDKNIYKQGDTINVIWTAPSSDYNNMNAIVDLLDPTGNTFYTELRQEGNSGFSPLSWVIPATIKSGSYKIRVGNNYSDGYSDVFTIYSSPTITPSITVISPNGGETYKVGQQITVKWKTENISNTSKVRIDLYIVASGISSANSIDLIETLNDGSEVVTLPTTNSWNSMFYGKNFAIEIWQLDSNFSTTPIGRSKDTFTITSSISTNPVISGVSGPQTLNAGEEGKWTVSASDSSGGNLSYSVFWGDEGSAAPTATSSKSLNTSQTATFYHTYLKSGKFEPTFKVTNTSGGIAKTSLSVSVGSTTQILNTPTLNVSSSTPSQNIVVGSNGLANGSKVTYNFSSNVNKDIKITEIKYFTSGRHGAIKSIKISSSGVVLGNKEVVNYFAYFTGLNIVIPAGTTLSVDAYLSYAGVGVAGIPSGSTSQVQITDVKYVSENIAGNFTGATDPSPIMTLVSSPAIIQPPVKDNTSLSSNALDAFNSATNSEQVVNTDTTCGEFTLNLSKGMDNQEVKCLQKMLIEKGYKIEGVEKGSEITFFGYNTLIALKKFQSENNLAVDGIFGPASRTALKK